MVIIIGQSSDSIPAEERNLQSLLELAQIDKRVNGDISSRLTRTVQSTLSDVKRSGNTTLYERYRASFQQCGMSFEY